MVLDSERHGKGPLALGAWRPKNTRLAHFLRYRNMGMVWFWILSVMAKDPWRLALGGPGILDWCTFF